MSSTHTVSHTNPHSTLWEATTQRCGYQEGDWDLWESFWRLAIKGGIVNFYQECCNVWLSPL